MKDVQTNLLTFDPITMQVQMEVGVYMYVLLDIMHQEVVITQLD